MFASRRFESVRKATFAALAAGILLGSNCSPTLEVLSAGLGEAARQLDRADRNNNISLGDWLADEVANY